MLISSCLKIGHTCMEEPCVRVASVHRMSQVTEEHTCRRSNSQTRGVSGCAGWLDGGWMDGWMMVGWLDGCKCSVSKSEGASSQTKAILRVAEFDSST